MTTLEVLINTIKSQHPYSDSVLTDMAFYDENKHKILQRPDKIVNTYEKVIDNGVEKTRKTGTKDIRTAKIPFTFEKKIVETAVAFLFGAPVTISAVESKDEKNLSEIMRAWNAARMDYHNKSLARRIKVEGRAAELLTFDESDSSKIRIQILSRKHGFKIYPWFEGNGNLKYILIEYTEVGEDGSETGIQKVYSKEKIWTITDGKVNAAEEAVNKLKRIPIVYYEQGACEWEDVKTNIEKYDERASRHSDTNDYLGAPAIKAKGTIGRMPDKDSDVRLYQIKPDISGDKASYGDVEYLTYDSLPESVKLDLDRNEEAIFKMTFTPDISFNNVKGIGNISGKALKLLFLDAIVKAKNSEEIYGVGINRRLNLIAAMKGMQPVPVKIEFNSILPDFIDEILTNLSTATGGKQILSTETAVAQNPLVSDPKQESEKIIIESAREMGGSM